MIRKHVQCWACTTNQQCRLQCCLYALCTKKTTTKKTNTDIRSSVWFNPTSLYICDKKMCPLLSLHNKPTLTSKVFNAGFNALLTKIRNHLLCYLFGNAYSQYVGEIYNTTFKSCFSQIHESKGYQEATERVHSTCI